MAWYRCARNARREPKVGSSCARWHSNPRGMTTATQYRDYLQSDHWKQFRESIIRARRMKCEVCASPVDLNVHHKHYRLGDEKPRHVSVLCRFCHEQFHKHFKMHIRISRGVFRSVRRRLRDGLAIDEAWSKTARNFHQRVVYLDRKQERKRQNRSARTRLHEESWKSKYDIPLSYYLARDERETAET